MAHRTTTLKAASRVTLSIALTTAMVFALTGGGLAAYAAGKDIVSSQDARVTTEQQAPKDAESVQAPKPSAQDARATTEQQAPKDTESVPAPKPSAQDARATTEQQAPKDTESVPASKSSALTKNEPIVSTAEGVAINAENFPNKAFRNIVAREDANRSGVLEPSEIAGVKEMDIPGPWQVETLLGIEYFTALEVLICNYNQLTSLDVSKNTALTFLSCSNNEKLTSLDVSKNTALNYLNCTRIPITSLDLSKNTALAKLYCSDSQLTSLDLSKNTALTFLACAGVPLISLDLSKNTALDYLACGENQLTSLDVSKNTALKWLECENNQLTSLVLPESIVLKNVYCRNNQLTSLDVSKTTALEALALDNNQLTSLDVSKTTALVGLGLGDNQLASLLLPESAQLRYLRCSNNQLTSLDVSKNIALDSLSVDKNQLASLLLPESAQLRYLRCSNNQLTSLDVSKTTALNALSCDNNRLPGLDLGSIESATIGGGGWPANQQLPGLHWTKVGTNYVFNIAQLLGSTLSPKQVTNVSTDKGEALTYDPLTGLATWPISKGLFLQLQYDYNTEKTPEYTWESISIVLHPIVQVSYTLTATAGSGGSVTPASMSVPIDSSQIFDFTCEEGFVLDKVTVDANPIDPLDKSMVLTNSSLTLKDIKADHAVHATFKKGIVDPPTDPTGPTDPTDPPDPTDPTDPVPPVGPIDPPLIPIEPIDPPIKPVEPVVPIKPVDPIDPPLVPIKPIDPPVKPVKPVVPVKPIDPPVKPVKPVVPIIPPVTSTDPIPPVNPTKPINPNTPPATLNNPLTPVQVNTDAANTSAVPLTVTVADTAPEAPAVTEEDKAAPIKADERDSVSPQSELKAPDNLENVKFGAESASDNHHHIPLIVALLSVWLLGAFWITIERKRSYEQAIQEG